MRRLFILVMLVASLVATQVLAQSICCQCGPSACGPALEGGDCTGCEVVPNAVCDGDSGQCSALLEGSVAEATRVAPALGGGPLILLAAGLMALGLSLPRRRRAD